MVSGVTNWTYSRCCIHWNCEESGQKHILHCTLRVRVTVSSSLLLFCFLILVFHLQQKHEEGQRLLHYLQQKWSVSSLHVRACKKSWDLGKSKLKHHGRASHNVCTFSVSNVMMALRTICNYVTTLSVWAQLLKVIIAKNCDRFKEDVSCVRIPVCKIFGHFSRVLFIGGIPTNMFLVCGLLHKILWNTFLNCKIWS